MYKIAIDIMGGDFAPLEQIKGVEQALNDYDDVELYLYGDEKIIKQKQIWAIRCYMTPYLL